MVMEIERLLKEGYEFIAIAPDRDPAKDRDVTGDVDELLQIIAGLGDTIAGRTKPLDQVRRELRERRLNRSNCDERVSKGMVLATLLHLVLLLGVWFFLWRDGQYAIAIICGLLLVAPPVTRGTGAVLDAVLFKPSTEKQSVKRQK